MSSSSIVKTRDSPVFHISFFHSLSFSLILSFSFLFFCSCTLFLCVQTTPDGPIHVSEGFRTSRRKPPKIHGLPRICFDSFFKQLERTGMLYFSLFPYCDFFFQKKFFSLFLSHTHIFQQTIISIIFLMV